jgi:hypothetical protein
MNLRRKLYNVLPPPQYKASLVSGWQQVDDIVKAMLQQHKENEGDAKKIAKYFCGRNERETAQNIFNFLKSEIVYEVEPSTKQSVKSISRFLADGKGDCKHFTNFANSILSACGYEPVYRYAGYSNKGLQHTYTFLPKSNTILDAVLPSFDTEKTPTIKKDYKMSLYKLSGIQPESEISGVNFTKIKDGLKKASTKTNTAVNKAVKQIPDVANKITQGMKTTTLAIPRTAFTGLVALNFRGLATSLKKLVDKKGKEGLKWWLDLGGNRDTLMDAINNGSTKKRILGPEEEQASYREVYGGYSGDGVFIGEPVTIATAIATATPILIQVEKILKANDLTENISQIQSAVKSGKDTFKQITGKNLEDVVFKKDSGAESKKSQLSANDFAPVDDATATKIAESSIALATGTDIKTITEMRDIQLKTGINPPQKKWWTKPSGILGIGLGLGFLYYISKRR